MSNLKNKIHPSAIVDNGVSLGNNVAIWHFSHICTGAIIGDNCSFGQNTMIAGKAKIGKNVKVQNNVSIYDGVIIEDDVFLGPSCVLTNVTNPRSQITRKKYYEKTLIKIGATIGANATIVCGSTVGKYAFVGAGAVVSCNVPDYALMLGVPAKQKGWMSRHGHLLNFKNGNIQFCPESKLRYKYSNGKVFGLDVKEGESLPKDLTCGKSFYNDFKN